MGYKLHLDVACCGVPITAVLTSASVYDNQVSVPLARLSAQRVTSLYTLMDAAYDSEPLRQLERELGHVPIVAINSRGRENPPTLDAAEKKRIGPLKRYAAPGAFALLVAVFVVGNFNLIPAALDSQDRFCPTDQVCHFQLKPLG